MDPTRSTVVIHLIHWIYVHVSVSLSLLKEAFQVFSCLGSLHMFPLKFVIFLGLFIKIYSKFIIRDVPT